MENPIQIFNDEAFGQVRVVLDEETNEPWFCGLDVCNILQYSDHKKAIKRHIDEEDTYAYFIIDSEGDARRAAP